VLVTLERETNGGAWEKLGSQKTDDDGRARDLLNEPLVAGSYRLTLDVGSYFKVETFYRDVTISFIVRDASQHYHVPLLLSPFGYSTYRGS
jgi:5-hydroxyisourate hydrolase